MVCPAGASTLQSPCTPISGAGSWLAGERGDGEVDSGAHTSATGWKMSGDVHVAGPRMSTCLLQL